MLNVTGGWSEVAKEGGGGWGGKCVESTISECIYDTIIIIPLNVKANCSQYM
jgi:hypothetical protein